MGVTYVTGRAGSGKTEYILREAKAAVRAGKRVLVVTPELMTLSMEQALLADLPVLWNLEVLSPSRLQAKLRQELGGSDAVMLDDAGRAMALRAVWTQLKDGLSYYTSMSGGFLERLVSQIKELRAGELGATGLRLAADSLAEGVTRDKLYDLAAILDGYERFMAGKYMDGEDAADRFCAAAHHSRWLRDAHVFVDGFDVLPLKTCRMFLALCKACKSVTLSFRTDSGFGRDAELFAPVQEGYECLHRMVLQQGLAWTKIDLRPRQKGEPSLDHLERELFARPAVAYAKTPEGLELAALHDGELEAAAVRGRSPGLRLSPRRPLPPLGPAGGQARLCPGGHDPLPEERLCPCHPDPAGRAGNLDAGKLREPPGFSASRGEQTPGHGSLRLLGPLGIPAGGRLCKAQERQGVLPALLRLYGKKRA